GRFRPQRTLFAHDVTDNPPRSSSRPVRGDRHRLSGAALSFAFDEPPTSTLVVLLIPVMSFWLDISPTAAFVANLGLLAFFLVYAIAITWAFDRVFGLPASAMHKDPRKLDDAAASW